MSNCAQTRINGNALLRWEAGKRNLGKFLLIEESFQDSEIKRIVIDAQLGYSFFLVEALHL